MKIQIIDKKKDRLVFVLSDSTPFYANAIRRTILDEVPTLAIEDVEFRKNSSIFYDEMIAHRLGLVPLVTDLKAYTPTDECTCKGEGCAKCQVTATLKVKGPKMVYASDLKFADPAIKPAYPDTPIVKLLKNQDLEIEAAATLGKGKYHVKWSPGHVFYRYQPEIEIGKVDNPEEIAKICPTKVFEVKNKKLGVKDLNACILCGACVDISNGNVRVNEPGNSFIFTLESFGQLGCEEIIKKALDILENQLKEFTEKL